MTDFIKITDLPASAPALTDVSWYDADPAGSPVSKQATIAQLIRSGHGSISASGNVTAQAMTAAYAKLNNFDADGLAYSLVPDFANGRIQIPEIGTYRAHITLVALTDTAAFHTFQCFWNSGAVGIAMPWMVGTAAGVFHFTSTFSVLAIDQYLELHALTASDGNLTVGDALIDVQRIL